jgi:hypothetical protein
MKVLTFRPQLASGQMAWSIGTPRLLMMVVALFIGRRCRHLTQYPIGTILACTY